MTDSMEAKSARNARVSARYDALMAEGKHGHYETMFRVVREEVERAAPEAAEPVAPAAKIVMKGGEIVKAATYMPGLPDGEHELYAAPTDSQAGRDAVEALTSVWEQSADDLSVDAGGHFDAGQARGLRTCAKDLRRALSTTAGRAE